MEKKHLITPQQFVELARPTSTHLDDAEVLAYIDECENMFIIPAIGYGNFEHAVNLPEMLGDESTFDKTFDGTFDDLFEPNIWLDGGSFEKCDGCGCGTSERGWCVGLRKTLAYYVYARMGRSDGSIVARAGYMRHNDQYADHVQKDVRQYNDVMSTAEAYLAGCLEYAKCHTIDKKITPVRSSRAAIKAIGD